MKIVDVPQTGSLGLTVTYPSRYGLIRRTRVTPANPQSARQLIVRGILTSVATAWDNVLSEDEQNAWIAAAAQVQSRPTLGQSGPLTGLQFFMKIAAALSLVGEEMPVDPPAKPQMASPPIDTFTITNTGGTIALRLHTTDAPAQLTTVWASAPQKCGTRRPISMRYLGLLPTPVASYSNFASLYSAKYGDPAVGSRVMCRTFTIYNGWEGPALNFSALVPVSS